MANKPVVSATPGMEGKLKVTVISASGLIASDALVTGGKSDPYCVLRVGPAGLKRSKVKKIKGQKTKVVKNTVNPTWNEEMEFDVDNGHFQTLYVDIYDWDRVGSNDYLGFVDCGLGFVTTGCQCIVELDVQKGKGTIKLGLEGVNFGYFQDDMAHCVEKTRAHSIPPNFGGKIHVTIVSAKGLKDVDVVGAADPFVVSIMRRRRKMKNPPKKKQKFKTKVLKGKNPTWNQTHEFKVKDCEQQFLEFQLMDWDRLSSNDPMGLVILPLSSLAREKKMDFSLPIELGKGTLQISVLSEFGYLNRDMQELFQETVEKSVLVGKEVVAQKAKKGKGKFMNLITNGAGLAKAASVVVPM